MASWQGLLGMVEPVSHVGQVGGMTETKQPPAGGMEDWGSGVRRSGASGGKCATGGGGQDTGFGGQDEGSLIIKFQQRDTNPAHSLCQRQRCCEAQCSPPPPPPRHDLAAKSCSGAVWQSWQHHKRASKSQAHRSSACA